MTSYTLGFGPAVEDPETRGAPPLPDVAPDSTNL